ncbi:MAG TPA: hypothetical protein ENN68_09650 [Methanomicrobia archaeon]|nr:hypothetical protein [Methanomicrobia archaeon]
MKSDMNTSKKNLRAAGALVIIFLFVIVLGFGVFAFNYEYDKVLLYPLFVVYGVGALLACLALVVIVLSALNLSDPKGALGLPEGSVRAIIALSLLIIFIITATFLYSNIASPIPGNDTVNNTVLYTERVKFAQQILTTVSTLVVAVAGFYFGTRSVQEARGVSEQPSPSLHILKPESPVTLDGAPGTELTIEVEARGAAISWGKPPSGDTDGTIEHIEPGKFKYKRGTKAETNVILKFSLVDHPEVTKELIVEKTK